MKTLLLRLFASVLLVIGAAPALAAVDLVGDDTDLFTRNPSIPSQIPNVLIVLDNSPNWSRQSEGWPSIVDATCTAAGMTGNTQGDAQLCGIYKVISNLDEQVNVGLMMFNAQNKGAYVKFPMLPMNTTNRDALKLVVKNIATVGNGVNDTDNKAASNSNYENPLNDAFRYFNSFATYNSPSGTDPAGVSDVRGYTNTSKNVFSFLANTKDNACGYDYIIFVGNRFPDTHTTYSSEIDAAAALFNDSSVTVNKSVLQATGRSADIWSRFMFQYGVRVKEGVYRHITTYALDVCNAHCEADQATLLGSMASVSQGKYFQAKTLSAIETALSQIFQEVQAVNSVFAATTLPVSINVRGTNLNQVYIGVFRPDPSLSPRWMGNLKQYKLGVIDTETSQLGLVDDAGANAVNLNTGFISNTAPSIWTQTSTFWSYRTPFAPTDAGGASDRPDGDLVEKGGAAQKIRQAYSEPDGSSLNTDFTSMVRNIYTCTGDCLSDPANNPFCDGTEFDATRNECMMGYLFKSGDSTVTRASITAASLGTFATTPVDLLTGTSSNVATATINAGHTFIVGQDVVIAGATPSAYNGQHTITAVTGGPPTTTLSYSVSPNTLDTTHAYVTFPSYSTTTSGAVTPGTDTVDVSATPSTYDVTGATITAVVGNINQFSYTLSGSPSYPTTVASDFTVTANRRVTSAVWSSDTGKITATAASHGYTVAGALLTPVVISGATPGEFNGTYSVIGDITQNTFTYTPLTPPAGATVSTAKATTAAPTGFVWVSGNTVIICSGGPTATTSLPVTCTNSSAFNSSGSGASITVDSADSSGNTFSYGTSGTPTAGTAGGAGFTAVRVSTVDSNIWARTGGNVSGSTSGVTSASGNHFIELPLTLSSITVTGQNRHPLAVGDKIVITGMTCAKSNNAATACVDGGTAGAASFQVTVTAVTNPTTTTATIKWQTDSQTDKYTISSGTFTWSATNNSNAPTFSPGVAIGDAFGVTPTATGPVAGAASVTATGTIKARRSGDLAGTPNGSADKVTSIASQSIATGSITVAAVTSTDANERENLIAWVRGADNKDNENTNSVATDVRASVHGDVLHSRPAVVNYNRNSTSSSIDDNDVFIFYGANDGMLHAIKGGDLAHGGGKEQWAFIAPEFFGKLKRLRDQSPGISSSNPREYFFDGPIGVYTLDVDRDTKYVAGDNDKVYLFVGMRRGGRMIYAFDVSDPQAPKLLWKKGCTATTGTASCDTGFGELGQTWSEPKLGYLRNWPDTLALIFGAGNDAPVEDIQSCFVMDWYNKPTTGDTARVKAKTGIVVPTPMDATNCKAITDAASGSIAETSKIRSMGRGIFILNAATGEVLYRIGPNVDTSTEPGKLVAEMEFAMPGDLAVLRNRTNTGGRASDIGAENVPVGYLDRIYATDTGGNVWRIDVSAVSPDSNPPDFAVSRLASVASTTVASGAHPAANYRKFLFNPDVVYSTETNGTQYDALLIGSGDREHPFDNVVNNRFYMIKDKNVGSLIVSQIDETSSDLAEKWAAPGNNATNTVLTESDLFDVTNNCLQAAANCDTGQTQDQARTDLAGKSGWKLLFPNTGEKTVATATTAAGTVIFNTNQPKQDTVTGQSASACVSDLGTARQYGISYEDATSKNIFSSLPTQYVEAGGRDAMFAGGGFLPTPVPVVVQIGGKYYQTVIAGVQTTNPGGLKFQSRLRTYWFRKTD